ncbi:outer membrane protein assembly factor BamE [Buchnera aphidicola]|uniref:Outer membrane protein assembly factor BamE n=1 Tax=Buchnera aphidicola (Aphis gossypii) TaxID=98785 RepID=A0A5J6Z9F7_9GAMM|nr:outer membrane protein assembly factor BamE [Buchnera aphidicola]QFQ32032.1 outer membrane protein assembly factor BamE [Buchnera aphidicola (Aphis gossypii)]
MNIQVSIIKILLIIFLLTSCSFFGNKSYNSNNIDALYLNLSEFKKNYKGMTREQIIYIFGDPIVSDSFDNAYHYIFCQRFKKNICKKIVLNIFFKNDKVCYFNLEQFK